MQQVRPKTQAINQTQSLQAIQTLLRAGLGTIAYLRNLLPEDNFNKLSLMSMEDMSSSQSCASQESQSSRTHVSGFQMMNISRGYTDEADRILNYLENGIFDALEKRYLRSVIFGIYLDANNPTNIVEAYTFNFKYHQIPESGVFIPVMSLAEGRTVSEDPITKALKRGKVPTLKDVKLSVKALIKTLIQAIRNMDILPRRRFATFKLFYTDETPPEYEPPHFESGDAERDKWYFMTHDLDEVPERTSIGKVHTGHHSVNLNVTSIASYLPSPNEHGDNAAFTGVTGERSVLTPQQEASFCKNEAENQYEDAKNRNLVWLAEDSVELSDAEADGEDDPDYVRLPDGTYEKMGNPFPVGVRNESGGIDDLPAQTEMHFGGIAENVPQRLQEVVNNIPTTPAMQTTTAGLEETQPLPKTFVTPAKKIPAAADLFASDHSDSSLSSVPQTPDVSGFDPEMLASMRIDVPETSDTEMLDLETQIPTFNDTEVNESCTPETVRGRLRPRNDNIKETSTEDDVVSCDCEIQTDDGCCLCEGPCGKWYHIWCIGYHSVDDTRIPAKFICVDCRIRQDNNWDLIKVNWYPQIVLRAKDLASMRRAIKVALHLQSFVSADFSKSYGNHIESARLLKILQDKEFLLQETIALDDIGVKHATRHKKGKGKDVKNNKTRKNMQKTRYVFNHSILTKREYLDYFEPDNLDLIMKLMGISTEVNKPAAVAKDAMIIEDTQTQEETQECTTPTRNTYLKEKRGASRTTSQGSMGPPRPLKRLKMSVAAAVDLAE